MHHFCLKFFLILEIGPIPLSRPHPLPFCLLFQISASAADKSVDKMWTLRGAQYRNDMLIHEYVVPFDTVLPMWNFNEKFEMVGL